MRLDFFASSVIHNPQFAIFQSTIMFPANLPPATTFYLWCYMVTLIIHVAFMNYVLAGTAYLAITSLFERNAPDATRPNLVATVLRDWIPFALGLAITAGVAPLLFVQVLYKQHYYTANLLLFHRWMSILPVLIVAFYLLYIVRSRLAEKWPHFVWFLAHLAIFGCFAFISYSWVENHLLSRHAEAWTNFYAVKKWFFWDRELAPRWALWFVGSIAAMATLVGWQLFALRKLEALHVESEVERVSLIALTGLILTAVFGVLYYAMGPSLVRERITANEIRPYPTMAGVGLLVQAFAWTFQLRQTQFRARWLGLASAGAILTLTGAVVAREYLRVGSIAVEKYFNQHAHAASVGGFRVFLVFFILNTILIAGSIYLVRHSKMFADSGEK